MTEQPALTPEQRTKFLELIHQDPSLGTANALRTAGVQGSRGQLKQLVRGDDELAQEAREARGYGDQAIRAEMARRAIVGVDEPVFHQGQVVGYVRKYSDRLLGMMAKAHLAEYRDKVEVDFKPAPTPIEGGRRPVGLADVFRLAHELGIRVAVGVDAAGARPALPAPPDVLAEPPESQ